MSNEKIFNVVAKREFYTISADKPTIGLLMMVKNEKLRIHVTLESILNPKGRHHVDCLIIYDTNSEDQTREIIIEFCEKHKINLYMIQGAFIDFSTSRNVSLDFADTIPVKFLLLLDCNDQLQLQNGNDLRKFAESQMTTETSGYLTCQSWWSGNLDKYFNMRFLKARQGWKYMGVVHEWLKDTSSSTDQPRVAVAKMPDNIVLYQDRTADDDKTGKRFSRDRLLLFEDYKKDPKETRTLFYLAQTCACLGIHEEAFYYYKIRSGLEGFQEEKFHAFLRCGDLSKSMNHSWHDTLSWYMKALEHTARAEPLNKIASHYNSVRNWYLAYNFAKLSCQLEYPEHLILFVDKRAYDYERWHLLGISAYYVGKFQEGKQACLKAIEAGVNVELDTCNLKFYTDRTDKERERTEKEMEEKKEPLPPSKEKCAKEVTKKEFMDSTIPRLKLENPKATDRQLQAKATLLWKLRNKK